MAAGTATQTIPEENGLGESTTVAAVYKSY